MTLIADSTGSIHYRGNHELHEKKGGSVQGGRSPYLCSASAVTTYAQDSVGLEEIIVTARKVEENLQETPIAITALTGDALVERQIFNTNVLDQVVPNLQFADNAPLAGNNSSSQVFIRGIGQTDPTSTVDPGVGLYIDDVYIGNAVGGTMTLRDIASVQVLRGPQGTLFGRNTIGGAILLHDDAIRAMSLAAPCASAAARTVCSMASSRSTRRSRTRSRRASRSDCASRTATSIRPDGTDLGDTDTYTGTAKFVWTPIEQLTGTLAFDYTESDENGTPLVFAAITEGATFPRVASFDAGCPGQAQQRAAGADGRGQSLRERPAGARPLRQQRLAAAHEHARELGRLAEARVRRSAMPLSLKSITAYREIDWEGVRDADNTPLPILHTIYDVDGDQLSQELQLTYRTGRADGRRRPLLLRADLRRHRRPSS